MTSVEDKLRAAIRAKAGEIETEPPPLRLPARRRRSVFLAYGGGEKDGTHPRPAWREWLAPAASSILVGTIALAAVAVAGSRYIPSFAARSPAALALRPSPDSYLGVYAAGAPPGYGPIAEFATAAGRKPGLVGYFSRWAEPFDTTFATTLRDHGAVMLVQIDPTTNASLTEIANGVYDNYLRSYADSVRDFGHPVVIGFGHDMNTWPHSRAFRYVRPARFVAAWRHIVTSFRRQCADNVTWLWTVQADGPRIGPAAPWWPGTQYVSWVGIDGFYYRPSDTFTTLFGPAIAQVRSLTAKPILLSETGVGPQAGAYSQILNLFHGIAAYGLLGLVWFDIGQRGGLYHQDWRLEDSPTTDLSFRLGVRTYMAHH